MSMSVRNRSKQCVMLFNTNNILFLGLTSYSTRALQINNQSCDAMMLHWAIVLLAVCVVWTKASELRWQPKRVEARPDDAGRLSRCRRFLGRQWLVWVEINDG